MLHIIYIIYLYKHTCRNLIIKMQMKQLYQVHYMYVIYTHAYIYTHSDKTHYNVNFKNYTIY